MCSIIGYYSKSPSSNDRGVIQSIFVQSKIRGTHSFGISYLNPGGQVITFKTHNLAEILIRLERLDPFPRQLIGHTRYSTSGDWHAHSNNQPIDIKKIAFAFNGVIDMRTREDWQQTYRCRFETDNDGEIFIRHLLKGGNPIEFVRQKKRSFAGVYLKNGEIYALRNVSRPMWQAVSVDSMFIASTQDIFKRASPNLVPSSVIPFRLLNLREHVLQAG